MEDALHQLEVENRYLVQLVAVLEQKLAILEQELLLRKSVGPVSFPSDKSNGNQPNNKFPPNTLQGDPHSVSFPSNNLQGNEQAHSYPTHNLHGNVQQTEFPPHHLHRNETNDKYPSHDTGHHTRITKEELLQQWLRSSVMNYRGRDVTKDCAVLLWRLRDNPAISSNEMKKLFGLSASGVRKRIMRMKKHGLLQRTGKQKYQPTYAIIQYMDEILKRTGKGTLS